MVPSRRAGSPPIARAASRVAARKSSAGREGDRVHQQPQLAEERGPLVGGSVGHVVAAGADPHPAPTASRVTSIPKPEAARTYSSCSEGMCRRLALK